MNRIPVRQGIDIVDTLIGNRNFIIVYDLESLLDRIERYRIRLQIDDSHVS
jgi:hypothetical protein